ncbi:hypothetical protein ABZZ79_00295 [Streptomyces sp. NPDC006458]|uniref:hypothetical protein n=1 Tax=Streptomyces sp. NPDC006458 TaxID=3154302 RepID=UPI0033A8C3B3
MRREGRRRGRGRAAVAPAGAAFLPFLPFLAGTLLRLLDSGRTPREWRNGAPSNTMPAPAGLLFLVLCVKQVWDHPWSEFF